jgi:hypothetical protein
VTGFSIRSSASSWDERHHRILGSCFGELDLQHQVAPILFLTDATDATNATEDTIRTLLISLVR